MLKVNFLFLCLGINIIILDMLRGLKKFQLSFFKKYPIFTEAFETTKLKGSVLSVICKASKEKFSDGKGCDVGDHSCNKIKYNKIRDPFKVKLYTIRSKTK